MHTVTKKNIDLIVTTLYPQAMFGYIRSNTHLEVWEVQRFCATRSFVEKLPVVGWLMASAIHWADLGTGLVWAAAPAARRRHQQMQLRWSWTPEGNSKIFKELHLFRKSPYSDHVLTEEIRSGYTFVTWITISHGSKHTDLILYVRNCTYILYINVSTVFIYHVSTCTLFCPYSVYTHTFASIQDPGGLVRLWGIEISQFICADIRGKGSWILKNRHLFLVKFRLA